MLAGTVVQDEQTDALEGQEERERDTNDGMRTLATMTPMIVPMTRPVSDRGGDREVPVPAVAVHQPRHHRRADAGGVAGGQVDLAEQQDEHQAHGDEDRAAAFAEHVREVVQRAEARLDEQEEHDEHDQAADGRQRAHVATAHAQHVVVEVVADTHRLGGETGRHRHFGGGERCRSAGASVFCRSVMPRPRWPFGAAELAGGDQLDELLLVDVASAARGRPIWPRYMHGDLVGDLQYVDHVVRDQHDGDTAVGEAAHQVEHLRGLRDARARRSARRGRRPSSSTARPWRSRPSAAARRTGWTRAAAPT